MNFEVYYGNVTKNIKLLLLPGKYRFECWGARGAEISGVYGCGGYTAGEFALSRIRSFFVYIGGKGIENTAGYNGGGLSQKSGGGATDVRLQEGKDWDDFESLKSRIMVAGGAGGTDGTSVSTPDQGGCGGGIKGGNSQKDKGKGGNQTSGGEGLERGLFGKGGSNNRIGGGTSTNDGNGAGGGGYYGGGTSTDKMWNGGGGGSSFISGHNECDAIDKDYTIENPIHTGKPIHYSGFAFKNTKMIEGCSSSIPLPNNLNNGKYCDFGAFRLTILGMYKTCQEKIINKSFLSLFVLIYI